MLPANKSNQEPSRLPHALLRSPPGESPLSVASPVSLPVPRRPPRGTQCGLRSQSLLSADLDQVAVSRGPGEEKVPTRRMLVPGRGGQGTPPHWRLRALFMPIIHPPGSHTSWSPSQSSWLQDTGHRDRQSTQPPRHRSAWKQWETDPEGLGIRMARGEEERLTVPGQLGAASRATRSF